jgi:hypothetical protein
MRPAKLARYSPGGSVGRANYSAAATSHGARRRGTDSSAWRYGDGSRETRSTSPLSADETALPSVPGAGRAWSVRYTLPVSTCPFAFTETHDSREQSS